MFVIITVTLLEEATLPGRELEMDGVQLGCAGALWGVGVAYARRCGRSGYAAALAWGNAVPPGRHGTVSGSRYWVPRTAAPVGCRAARGAARPSPQQCARASTQVNESFNRQTVPRVAVRGGGGGVWCVWGASACGSAW